MNNSCRIDFKWRGLGWELSRRPGHTLDMSMHALHRMVVRPGRWACEVKDQIFLGDVNFQSPHNHT